MTRLPVCTVILGALLPLAAQAAPGYLTEASAIAAGPGDNYPSIGTIPSGAVVNVVGCIGTYRWCDVAYKADRGWVTGDRLKVAVEGRYMSLADYGMRSGVPVTIFEQVSYWDSNYRSRAFYNESDYWRNMNRQRAQLEEAERVRGAIVKQEVREELRAEESAATRSSGGRR